MQELLSGETRQSPLSNKAMKTHEEAAFNDLYRLLSVCLVTFEHKLSCELLLKCFFIDLMCVIQPLMRLI